MGCRDLKDKDSRGKTCRDYATDPQYDLADMCTKGHFSIICKMTCGLCGKLDEEKRSLANTTEIMNDYLIIRKKT